MIWPSLISAGSGLVGALIGAGVALVGERGRREADTRRQTAVFEREYEAEARDLRAVARLEVARLVAARTPLSMAVRDKSWQLGASVIFGDLSEQDRRTLMRGIATSAYLKLTRAETDLASFALQQGHVREAVEKGVPEPTMSKSQAKALAESVADVDEALDALVPYIEGVPSGKTYEELLAIVKSKRAVAAASDVGP